MKGDPCEGNGVKWLTFFSWKLSMSLLLKIKKPLESKTLQNVFKSLGILPGSSEYFIESLPFSVNDTTAGSETELQTVVIGDTQRVDLPISIQQSNYFKNLLTRSRTGETSKKLITNLEKYLESNKEGIWDNSWVRFPVTRLNPYANEIFNNDLLANKKNKREGLRGDLSRFVFSKKEEKYLRLPISYLLKLAAEDWEIIWKSPMATIRLPKGSEPRVRYLLEEEEFRLFEVLKQDEFRWFRPVVVLARNTGLRRNNLVSLEWNDVDFKNRCTVIKKTKNKKPVMIPFILQTEEAFLELKRVRSLRYKNVILNKKTWKPIKDDYASRFFLRS